MEQFSDYKVPGAQHQEFFPYESNGGAIVAIAGDNFAIIAADTRLSSYYSIHTRNHNKLFVLSPMTVLGSAFCWCDAIALTSLVRVRMTMYEHLHLRTLSTNAIAQMLSILMYNGRFFPYYVWNVLAGLDSEGKGIVYSYDPIGHCESKNYHAGVVEGGETPKLTMERAVAVAIDSFISGAECDIFTGDSVNINIITKDGIDKKIVQLRKD